MMTVHDQFQGVGLVYTTLKRTFGDDFDAKANCSQIAFTKDYKSAIFDLPSELDEQLQGYWKDSSRMQLKTITELPEIDESSITSGGGSRGSYGGNRGGQSRGGGGGQRGGGDSGQNVCFNCQQPGHFSRECPQAKQGGRGGGDSNCFNCQQPGHLSRDCTEPRKSGGGGGGDNKCYNCQQTGHMSRDCPEPRSQGDNKCFNCQKTGHMSRECPEPRSQGGRGGGAGRGGGRGAPRGGSRGSFGGGQKRSFDSHSNGGETTASKKIKFDDDEE